MDTPSPQEAPQPKSKAKRNVIIVLIALGLFIFLMPLSNLLFAPDRPALPSARMQNPHFQMAGTVLQENCTDCHSEHTAKPWYFSMPVAKGMISQDVEQGVEALDVTEALFTDGGSFSPIQLAKIESVIHTQTMPPSRYVMMHWNASLAESEKNEVLDWVKSERKEKYASAHVAEEFAGEPIQPIPIPVIQNQKKVELGNKLFHDKRLSGDDTIACATCHALDKGGTDQAQFSTGIDGQVGGINSPTVYNAVFNHLQFWNGRAKDLHEQADGPVNNPIEMGANWDMVIPKIKKDPYYQQAFAELYSDGMTGPNACDAIAAFEETLVTPNSRFDKYLTGDKSALETEEIEGYHLFVQTGCTSCHLGVAVGGTHFEKMGRKKDYFAQRGNIGDADQGRFNVTKDEKERHKFKVPTLRNIAVTQPYFHDGQTKTLAEAIDIMATYQLGKTLPSQQIGKMEKFLLTLTGEYNGQSLEKQQFAW